MALSGVAATNEPQNLINVLPGFRKYYPPQSKPSNWSLLVVTLLAVGFAYPLLWMTIGGFKSNAEIFRPLQLLPESWSSKYFRQLWSAQWFSFGTVLVNSLMISAGQAFGSVVVTSMAGYVFARNPWRGVRLLFLVALMVIVVPPQVLAIPLFLWVNRLGLMDNAWGVILPGMASGLGIIYFTQIFRQLPAELIESARLEGAPELRVYLIVLPLMRASLVSFGLIQFILAWHQHLIPLLILNSPEQQTLPLALAGLYGSSLRFPYAVLMAGSTLAVIPTMVLFAIFFRQLKSSLADLLVH